jgi:hypothetical protein
MDHGAMEDMVLDTPSSPLLCASKPCAGRRRRDCLRYVCALLPCVYLLLLHRRKRSLLLLEWLDGAREHLGSEFSLVGLLVVDRVDLCLIVSA